MNFFIVTFAGCTSWLGSSSGHSFIGSSMHQTRAEYPRCAPRDPLRPVGQTWTGSLPGTEHASPGQINPDANHASIYWTSAVSLSMFSHLLKGTRLTPISELLRFLCTLVYPTTLIHPLHSPPHTIPEPSELVNTS